MRRSSATSLTVLLALGASLQLLPMASTVSASPRTTAPTGTQLECGRPGVSRRFVGLRHDFVPHLVCGRLKLCPTPPRSHDVTGSPSEGASPAGHRPGTIIRRR
jgi:hypothetical protein